MGRNIPAPSDTASEHSVFELFSPKVHNQITIGKSEVLGMVPGHVSTKFKGPIVIIEGGLVE
jgi:hypothetical protein